MQSSRRRSQKGARAERVQNILREDDNRLLSENKLDDSATVSCLHLPYRISLR